MNNHNIISPDVDDDNDNMASKRLNGLLSFFITRNPTIFKAQQMKIVSLTSKMFNKFYVNQSDKYIYRINHNVFDEKTRKISTIINNSNMNITEMILKLTADSSHISIEQPAKKYKTNNKNNTIIFKDNTHFDVPERIIKLNLLYNSVSLTHEKITEFDVSIKHNMEDLTINESGVEICRTAIVVKGGGAIQKYHADFTANVSVLDNMYSKMETLHTYYLKNNCSPAKVINWQIYATDDLHKLSKFNLLTTLKIHGKFNAFEHYGTRFPVTLKNLTIENNKGIMDDELLDLLCNDDNYMLDSLHVGVMHHRSMRAIIGKTRSLTINHMIQSLSLFEESHFVTDIEVHSQMIKFNIVNFTYIDGEIALFDFSHTNLDQLTINCELVKNLPQTCKTLIMNKPCNHIDITTNHISTFPANLTSISLYQSSIFNTMEGMPADLKTINLQYMDVMIEIPEKLNKLKLFIEKPIENDESIHFLCDSFEDITISIMTDRFFERIPFLHQLTILNLELHFDMGIYKLICPPSLMKISVRNNSKNYIKIIIIASNNLGHILCDQYSLVQCNTFRGYVTLI